MESRNAVTIPRGLIFRQGVWYVSRGLNGKMIRFSTKCSNLEAAKKVLLQFEMSMFSGDRNIGWQEHIGAISNRKGTWLQTIFSQICKGKHARTLEYDDLVSVAMASGGHCAVSGLPFSFKEVGRRKPFAPSLDRIDSAQGYLKGNVRLVCYIVNVSLNCWGDAPFLQMCKAVALAEVSKGTV